MITLENAGTPRNEQFPAFTGVTLRRLSDRIADAAEAEPVTSTAPKPRWLRRSALIAAAAAGVVVATSVLLPSPPAEAWSATPSLATGTARAELTADCQQMLGSSAPAALVEQRGTSHLTILTDSSVCLTAADLPGLDGAGPLRAGGQDAVPASEPDADQVQVVHAASLGGVGKAQPGAELPDGVMTAGYMGVTGRAGTAVEKVVVHTVDHGDVAASLEDGWFAAWWPSSMGPTSLTVTTSTGTYDLSL